MDRIFQKLPIRIGELSFDIGSENIGIVIFTLCQENRDNILNENFNLALINECKIKTKFS